jgi:hypothetical protein
VHSSCASLPHFLYGTCTLFPTHRVVKMDMPAIAPPQTSWHCTSILAKSALYLWYDFLWALSALSLEVFLPFLYLLYQIQKEDYKFNLLSAPHEWTDYSICIWTLCIFCLQHTDCHKLSILVDLHLFSEFWYRYTMPETVIISYKVSTTHIELT